MAQGKGALSGKLKSRSHSLLFKTYPKEIYYYAVVSLEVSEMKVAQKGGIFLSATTYKQFVSTQPDLPKYFAR